jgi:hypothetical protein
MFLASCASDTPQIIRITEENRHEEFDGLRFYEPEEYLSVGKKHDVKEDGVVEITEENGKRTRITEAIILPKERLIGEIVLMKNERKEYVIIGAHNVTLIDGWMLEGFYAKDSVLQKVSKKNLLHILDGAEGLTPGLYQFIKNEQGIVTSLKKIRVVQ